MGNQMVTINEAESMLNEIAESLPKAFFKELNGGILLLDDEKKSSHAKADDLYILGTYCRSSNMGNRIEIYYGSFQRLYPGCSKKTMQRHLKDVLLHEFTHHMEHLAGERGLEKKDEEQLRRYNMEHDLNV